MFQLIGKKGIYREIFAQFLTKEEALNSIEKFKKVFHGREWSIKEVKRMKKDCLNVFN